MVFHIPHLPTCNLVFTERCTGRRRAGVGKGGREREVWGSGVGLLSGGGYGMGMVGTRIGARRGRRERKIEVVRQERFRYRVHENGVNGVV